MIGRARRRKGSKVGVAVTWFLRRKFGLWSLTTALLCGAFANRRDVARWFRFIQRITTGRSRQPISELLTEAKVRLAVSTDPSLRRDKSLRDISVDDGVVTLHTSTSDRSYSRDQILRLMQVKGITEVDIVGDVGEQMGGHQTTPRLHTRRGEMK